MKKFHSLLLSIAILMVSGGFVGAGEPTGTLRTIENHTFARGEWLKFRVHYGFVTAGFLEMEVKPYKAYREGRSCYHIVGRGYTQKAFEWFYSVDDQYESYCDDQALVSWQFNRKISEGNFYSYSETHFDQAGQKARHIDNKKRETIYNVPVNVQDVISAFYYARARYDQRKLRVGDRIEMHNFIDRKPFRLEAKLLARETIKVEDKKYRALKFDLLIEEVGMITDGSTIQFWISDDDNKIPLRVESELMVGSLAADLIEAKGLVHPQSSLVE
ncbi:MAG: DUF3108 domain-containing protein [Bacteroidia bacterium]|nr:DUF3108 domain-containing protein [Bacteroidia bacterium]